MLKVNLLFRKSSVSLLLMLSSAAFAIATMATPGSAQTSSASADLDDLLKQGWELVEAGNYAQGIQVYERAAQLDRDNAQVRSGIGYLQAQLGDFAGAEQSYRDALALDPSNADYHYALGYMLAQQGKNTIAADAYRNATSLAPRNVKFLTALAVMQFRNEDYVAVQNTTQQIKVLDAKNEKAAELQGSVLLKQGNLQDAQTYLSNAIKQFPNNPNLRLQLAAVLIETQQTDAGLNALQTAENLSPDDVYLKLRIGALRQQMEDWPGAIAVYEKAIQIDPRSLEANTELGKIYLAEENYLQAILTYRRLVELLPEDPGAHYNLALALKGRNRKLEAKDSFLVAQKLYREQGDRSAVSRIDELLKAL
ncbi:MAG: tetratricopeptide repeat protein [Cyanobacteria bacterium P01_H01_bin.15]